MRLICLFFLALLASAPMAVRAAQSDPTVTAVATDGSTKESAIKVKSVADEYAILRQRHLQPKEQALVIGDDHHPYDVLTADAADGSAVTIWFDIKSFYGKEFEF